MFMSTYVNKVDRKGRVSVPATYRAALAGQSFLGIVAYPSFKFPCIEGSGIDRVQEMSTRVDSLGQFSEAYENLAPLFADAHQLAFDGEGRIVLPQTLVEHAGIGEFAAFVGAGISFQIWEPERHKKYQVEWRDRVRRQATTLPSRPLGPGEGR